MKKISFLIVTILFLSTAKAQSYTFPDESEPHEGTWLQWPHQYEYGNAYRNENDATWVAMTSALQANEKVHIIAYNATEQTRIASLLTTAGVPLTNVNFKIFQTNDVWVRDNGPIYVRNSSGNLVIEDYGFNGWGGDYGYAKDNVIPASIATANSTTILNLNSVLTIEGGAWEMDGSGTFLATKTSILAQTNPTTPSGILAIRNLGKNQTQVEAILTQYLGVTKFIWLDGWYSQEDITDAHIDGFAKFVLGNKLVTMNNADLLYWGASQADINTLYAATNTTNVDYTKVYLPLTQNNVSKTNGQNLGYKGSYINYYVANSRVLVPNYNDPNDTVANAIIAGLYPGRTVVGIDVRNLYSNGGMVHCVTQQQPVVTTLGTNTFELNKPKTILYPNPVKKNISLQTKETITAIAVYNEIGQKMNITILKNNTLDIEGLSRGTYFITFVYADNQKETIKFIKQ
jgi:agmatine deiminase